jgi:hypothetical protein
VALPPAGFADLLPEADEDRLAAGRRAAGFFAAPGAAFLAVVVAFFAALDAVFLAVVDAFLAVVVAFFAALDAVFFAVLVAFFAAGLLAAFLAVVPARDVAAFAADAVRLAAGFAAVFFAAAPDALVVRVFVVFAPAFDFEAAARVVRFVALAAFCAPLPAAVRPPADLDVDADAVFLAVVVFFAAVLRELAVFLAAGLRAELDFVLRVALGCGTLASPPRVLVGANVPDGTDRDAGRRRPGC